MDAAGLDSWIVRLRRTLFLPLQEFENEVEVTTIRHEMAVPRAMCCRRRELQVMAFVDGAAAAAAEDGDVAARLLALLERHLKTVVGT